MLLVATKNVKRQEIVPAEVDIEMRIVNGGASRMSKIAKYLVLSGFGCRLISADSIRTYSFSAMIHLSVSFIFAIRWRALVFVGVVAAVGLPIVYPQATPLADAAALRPGSIAGRVVRAADLQPAVGARIAYTNGPTGVVADEDGNFQLMRVPSGSHELMLQSIDGTALQLVDVVVRPGLRTDLGTLALPWEPPAGSSDIAHAYVVEPGRTFVFPYRHWTVMETVLAPGRPGNFDEIGVKNPSIVFHKGLWHLFFTSKPLPTSQEFKTALGYASAPEISQLAQSPRTEMRSILGQSVISPQVFYFEPQGLWYLIGHIGEPTKHTLEPVYSTNEDITNVQGWSPVRRLNVQRVNPAAFWIDFWVICDDQKAHLFYADHSGVLYRTETPLADFPHGFSHSPEQVAFELAGVNSRGDWRFYNAGHIYRVKSAGKYLALMEGAYAHPTRKRLRDARDRFLTAMLADKLEGPWRPVEVRQGEFLAEDRWLFDVDGERMPPRPVSHPEVIRSGYNQRLELDDFRLEVLFQTFDAREVETNYNYHSLPWRLMLMRNF